MKVFYQLPDVFLIYSENGIEINIGCTIFRSEIRQFTVYKIGSSSDVAYICGERQSRIGILAERHSVIPAEDTAVFNKPSVFLQSVSYVFIVAADEAG